MKWLALTFVFVATPVLAQTDPDRTVCMTVGGPIQLGTKDVTVGLKCCPEGSLVSDPEHPVDAKGNLICYRERT